MFPLTRKAALKVYPFYTVIIDILILAPVRGCERQVVKILVAQLGHE